MQTKRLSPGAPWDADEWRRVHRNTDRGVREASSMPGAWRVIHRQARRILRSYSTSFFIVTRFLPSAKREQVEMIYAAVRYPDEIVDTFPLPSAEQLRCLDAWGAQYESALTTSGLTDAVAGGVPALLAGFVSTVQANHIPPQHYRDFLSAMRRDVVPAPFQSLDELIDGYVYGSAVVVGFFLAHVYGPHRASDFPRALTSARELAIALQLTNFLRDVRDDEWRGRVYLPADMLRAEGIGEVDTSDVAQHPALRRVITRLSKVAETMYAGAAQNLDAFAPDCRTAIGACIAVYRQLNVRIGRSADGILHRERVPFYEKYRVLPRSKYWRLPLGYLVP